MSNMLSHEANPYSKSVLVFLTLAVFLLPFAGNAQLISSSTYSLVAPNTLNTSNTILVSPIIRESLVPMPPRETILDQGTMTSIEPTKLLPVIEPTILAPTTVVKPEQPLAAEFEPQMSVVAPGELNQAMTATSSNGDIVTSTTSPMGPVVTKIGFVYPPQVVSGNISVLVRSNKLMDKVLVRIEGQGVVREVEAMLQGESVNFFYNYKFYWDTSGLMNGLYKFGAKSLSEGRQFFSEPIIIGLNKFALASTTISESSRFMASTTKPVMIGVDAPRLASTSKPLPGGVTPIRPMPVGVDKNIRPQTPIRDLLEWPGNNSVSASTSIKIFENDLERFRATTTVVENLEKIADKQVYQPRVQPNGFNAQTNNEVCLSKNILKQVDCARYLASRESANFRQTVVDRQLASQCVVSGINSVGECTRFYIETQGSGDCRAHGYQVKSTCAKYLLDTFGQDAICQGMTSDSCFQYLFNGVLGSYNSAENLKRANEQAVRLEGKTININNTSSNMAINTRVSMLGVDDKKEVTGENIDSFVSSLPLSKNNRPYNISLLSTESSAESRTIRSAIIFDENADGIPDDIEAILDARQMAVARTINELKKHEDIGDLPPTLVAMIARTKIEEPQFFGSSSKELRVDKINQGKKERSLEFSGKARPGEVVNIFIYSAMPIIMTVKADSAGNWHYELDKSLVDGQHEAYVVIHNKEGRVIEKSSPLSFFVKEAKAVTKDEFVKLDTVKYQQSKPNVFLGWYLMASLILLVLSLAGVYFYRKNYLSRVNTNHEGTL